MPTDDAVLNQVKSHYFHGDLDSALQAGLEAAGQGETLRPEELAAVDEFHVRGRQATRELAAAAGIAPGMEVLDLGSGVGGPSRFLAEKYGCRVTGVDLSQEYCDIATRLAERLGLEGRVNYRQADAANLPFADRSFDLVWTQHVAMNIPDKLRLYREIRRVLKPAGRLALYDILSGPGGEPHFPVPWARKPEGSFLVSPQELSEIVAEAGFEPLSWQDLTEEGLSWFRRRQEKSAAQPASPLGLHLLLGSDFKAMARNQLLNLEQQRITLLQAVLKTASC